jgi:hypothetical protein
VLSSTENLEGETLRRLELKELLEVLEGALLADNDIQRHLGMAW